MSRIGNRVLNIPEGVTVAVEGNVITVKGAKGELSLEFNKNITIEVSDTEIVVKRANDTKEVKMLHGTTNALVKNMLIGVSEGYKKELEAVGVGYRFNVAGSKITVSAGYSNPVEVSVPTDLKAEQVSNTEI